MPAGLPRSNKPSSTLLYAKAERNLHPVQTLFQILTSCATGFSSHISALPAKEQCGQLGMTIYPHASQPSPAPKPMVTVLRPGFTFLCTPTKPALKPDNNCLHAMSVPSKQTQRLCGVLGATPITAHAWSTCKMQHTGWMPQAALM